VSQDLEDDAVRGVCAVFDAYGLRSERAEFGLLAVIEIYRSELEYALKHGGKERIQKLQKAGHYAYSDLDRPAVVWVANRTQR
jgi:isopentenyl diphosphate isomerase/L-lactate dehydrogenase-like FMN-dependent dehydrogenase